MKHGYVTLTESKLFYATAEGKAYHERELHAVPGVTSEGSGDKSYTLNWRVRPPKSKNVLQHPNAEVTASYSDVTPEVTDEKLQITDVTPPPRGVTCVTETNSEHMTDEASDDYVGDEAQPQPRSIPHRRRVESTVPAPAKAEEPRLPEGPLDLPPGWKESWTASKAHIQARNPDLELRTGAHPRTRSGLQELLRDIEKLEAEHALARRE
jgi:hypothetical protein